MVPSKSLDLDTFADDDTEVPPQETKPSTSTSDVPRTDDIGPTPYIMLLMISLVVLVAIFFGNPAFS